MTAVTTIVSPVNVEERKALDLRAGDTVKVYQRIKEGDKTRTQIFEGLVIARKHGREAGGTFTVRKVSVGIGVERIFPLYSPNIEKIDIIKRSKVRRAKLYYVREKAAKELRKRQKQILATEALGQVGFEKPEDKKETKAKEAEPQEVNQAEENTQPETRAGKEPQVESKE